MRDCRDIGQARQARPHPSRRKGGRGAFILFVLGTLSLSLFLLSLSPTASWLASKPVAAEQARPGHSPTARELREMTAPYLYANWEANRAHARGVGRVTKAGSQGLLLARRAALLDAERNLLLLRAHILKDPALNRRIVTLSGKIPPPVTSLGDFVENGLCFLDIEVPLSSLLGKKEALKGLQKQIVAIGGNGE
ncbi:MAG: hypothetical protein GX256_05745 [Fretibacterium sp.]|nr:hypothetical protein [Fretibacterium sp.]